MCVATVFLSLVRVRARAWMWRMVATVLHIVDDDGSCVSVLITLKCWARTKQLLKCVVCGTRIKRTTILPNTPYWIYYLLYCSRDHGTKQFKLSNFIFLFISLGCVMSPSLSPSPQLGTLNVNNIGIDFATGHCTHAHREIVMERETIHYCIIYRFNLFAIK